MVGLRRRERMSSEFDLTDQGPEVDDEGAPLPPPPAKRKRAAADVSLRGPDQYDRAALRARAQRLLGWHPDPTVFVTTGRADWEKRARSLIEDIVELADRADDLEEALERRVP